MEIDERNSNLSQLLSLLEQHNVVERQKTIFLILNKLKAGDSIAIDPLIKALGDSNHYIRLKAAKGLGIIRDKRGVEPLILALEDDVIDVKVEAANALRKIGDPRATERLRRVPNRSQKNIRKATIEALACKIDSRAAELIHETTRSSIISPNITENKINEIMPINILTLDSLIKALEDNDWIVRTRAARGLGVIRDLRGVEPLILALDDEAIDVRAEAASALGNIGDPRATEPLCRVLNSPHRNIRKAAIKALACIRDPRTTELIHETTRSGLISSKIPENKINEPKEEIDFLIQGISEMQKSRPSQYPKPELPPNNKAMELDSRQKTAWYGKDPALVKLCKHEAIHFQDTSLDQDPKYAESLHRKNNALPVISDEVELKNKGEQLLKKALNNPEAKFRAGQLEAIDNLVRKRARILVIQRTGWGKSIVYFLATRMLRLQGAGPTLLISPLRSLMRNQIQAANRLGINACTINSDNRDEWQAVKARLQSGDVDILLVAPERLENDEFRKDYLLPIAGTIGLFVVDEAHCISDWGHDFRPDFRRIARILQALPRNIPILATTATANNRVMKDIMDQLGTDLQVVRGSLARDSLCLQNIRLRRQVDRLAWLANVLPSLPGSGIIYALTIKHADLVAKWLRTQGIEAHSYSGRMETTLREELEQKLLDNQIKVLVATTSLGMGFDKPDLGFVIHFQRPGSVIHYYQQVGRAGRALDKAYGILLSGDGDKEITEYFIRNAFPPEEHVRHILNALASAGDDGLSVPMLEQKVNLPNGQIKKVLKLLAVETPSPIIKERTHWRATSAEYVRDRVKIDRLTAIRHEEQSIMDDYISSSTCLMRFLQKELDDENSVQCGRCAVCKGYPILPETFPSDIAGKAVSFLRKNEIIIHPHKAWPYGDALGTYNWKGRIPERLRAWKGRALSIWGDSGWGELVRIGKQNGHFDDRLVIGAADMVRERWKPTPTPTWISCIPSLNKPTLVPDFARRLSEFLGIPFIPCVHKVRATEPQKLMQNSYQQARNLEGAFEVDDEGLSHEPLILVDDMVDSGWTFAVVAALLRTAGTGPVFPLALADTSQGDNL